MSVQHAGSIIRQARLNAGLTQEQLSDGVCSTLSLSRIENGSAGVSPATFQTLMAHAGIFCEGGAGHALQHLHLIPTAGGTVAHPDAHVPPRAVNRPHHVIIVQEGGHQLLDAKPEATEKARPFFQKDELDHSCYHLMFPPDSHLTAQ